MQDIVRKKNTGEPGNRGEFGTVGREASGLRLDATPPVPPDPDAPLCEHPALGTVPVPGEPGTVVLVGGEGAEFGAHVLVPLDVDGVVDGVSNGRAGYRGRAKRWALSVVQEAVRRGLDEDMAVVEHDGETWLRVPVDADSAETPREVSALALRDLGLPGRDIEYELGEHLFEYLAERD